MVAVSENHFSKRFEPHVHTDYSDGKIRPEQAVDLGVAIKLKGLAVTDHHTIEGALIARDYAAKHYPGFEIELGIEVTLSDGRHVLGIGIDGPIDHGKSLKSTVEAIRNRGGIAILAHPNHKYGLDHPTTNRLEFALSHTGTGKMVDGWEVHNAALSDWEFGRAANQAAQVIFDQSQGKLGAPIAGSDNHFFRLGRAVTLYEGDFKTAVRERKTGVVFTTTEEDERITHEATLLFGADQVQREFRYKEEKVKVYANK